MSSREGREGESQSLFAGDELPFSGLSLDLLLWSRDFLSLDLAKQWACLTDSDFYWEGAKSLTSHRRLLPATGSGEWETTACVWTEAIIWNDALLTVVWHSGEPRCFLRESVTSGCILTLVLSPNIKITGTFNQLRVIKARPLAAAPTAWDAVTGCVTAPPYAGLPSLTKREDIRWQSLIIARQ